MAPLTLKPRPIQDDVECWDDDDDLQVDELQLASKAATAGAQQSANRESLSSRLSAPSEFDSVTGGDEERQVVLPADDEQSTTDAIASAINAGIPIPTNVPASALLGGTIKRLGGKRSRKTINDDWSEDLDLSAAAKSGSLKMKRPDENDFPDALPDFGGASPMKRAVPKKDPGPSFAARMNTAKPAPMIPSSLDRFRDGEGEDDDCLANTDNLATIRASKGRIPPKAIPFTSSPPMASDKKDEAANDDFEQDLELPMDGASLKLSTRKEIAPRTPANPIDDFDEWAEGSLGTRHGGTRRDARSPRSSSLSAMSPSLSSSFTVESEDEGLDGLVLPEGPLNLGGLLKQRQQTVSPVAPESANEKSVPEKTTAAAAPTKEDFFAGIEIGDGDVFDTAKLTLNRNIKHKLTRATSPTRRTAMTLTFTNKTQAATSRIPRLVGCSTDRKHPTLEPVAESGGPADLIHRAPSRLGGPSAPASTATNIPMPSTPSSRTILPPTPSRTRDLRTRPSMASLKPEPTTTNAQLLKMKRSMPAMRGPTSSTVPGRGPATAAVGPRPSTRGGHPSRPKTPLDRTGAESSLGMQMRKPPVPFLPAGTSTAQSHHVSAKTSRHVRRHDSESSIASGDVPTRSVSRAGAAPSRVTQRSISPRRKDLAPEALAREAAAKRTLVQPAKRRFFGDGSELEIFDDLPTSATMENRYVKSAIGRGPPKTMRGNKMNIGVTSDGTATMPMSAPLLSPLRPEVTPRFARDTHASRIAREQRTGTMGPVPLNAATLGAGWKTQLAVRSAVGMGLASTTTSLRVKRRHAGAPSKPHLIKPLGDTHNNPKSVQGMHYNPELYRWEGNENALAPFDAPLPTPTSLGPLGGGLTASSELLKTENGTPAPRPALITNFNMASPSVQVVGGMVFDPKRMCWLKLSQHPNHPAHHSTPPAFSPTASSSQGPPVLTDDDHDSEVDAFAGIDDLPEGPSKPSSAGTGAGSGTARGSGGPGRDEWLVGEEFDVGPEFIRRQREEEVRWRRKVDAWTGPGRDDEDSGAWRWAIQQVLLGGHF
ncbi:MAG: hypothetical protein M1823_004604 [Watsoniomyces obsoletus]|nr:MAG: hypothetical protein M1823_004604 [Watsoniomyces obsoletus]